MRRKGGGGVFLKGYKSDTRQITRQSLVHIPRTRFLRFRHSRTHTLPTPFGTLQLAHKKVLLRYMFDRIQSLSLHAFILRRQEAFKEMLGGYATL